MSKREMKLPTEKKECWRMQANAIRMEFKSDGKNGRTDLTENIRRANSRLVEFG